MQTENPTAPRPLGRFLALAAAVITTLVTLLAWGSVSGSQGMWPFPALYFVELLAAALIVAFLFLRADANASLAAWAAGGLVLAFSILGAFSVGLFYVPAALLFLLAGLVTDWTSPRRAAHLGLCLLAGVLQSALMLGMAAVFQL